MNAKNWLATLHEDREARTRRERHGQGELILLDGVPMRATGCVLPDGTFTDAECLLQHRVVAHETYRVWARRLSGSVLRRRGRLIVDSGKALLFIDEPAADLHAEATGSIVVQPDLERDLGLSSRFRGLVQSELFATLLYGALCNTVWRHKATGTAWSCSWRHAGNVVANLRCQGDYLDWYCSMGAGLVDEQVLAEIGSLGWELAEAEPSE
jgi:hypothetical protein